MRILSKFHDYYDKALAYGFDKSIVFVRNPTDREELDKRKWAALHAAVTEMPATHELCLPSLILFCGKAYPVWRIPEVRYPEHDGSYHTAPGRSCFSIEQWKASLTQEHVASVDWRASRRLDKFLADLAEEPRWKRLRDLTAFPFTPEGEARWREKHKAVLAATHEFHLAHKTPIALLEERYTEVFFYLNPRLQDYDFGRAVDPCTAFQEISMYLGGGPLAGQPDPVPEVADEVMRDAKGFDKRSFRTVSPGKKERRRAKKRSKK